MNQSESGFAGKAIIISAPSGSGKTSIAKKLLSSRPDLDFSVSACTRPPREGNEKQAIDYHFISKEEFHEKISNDEFIEWEEVYPGLFYGTLKSEVKRIWSEQKNVVFDVDVKGALKLKRYFGSDSLAIFIKAPSMAEIENRLRNRKTESEESIKTRLKKIKEELTFEKQFDVTVINQNLETAFADVSQRVKIFLDS